MEQYLPENKYWYVYLLNVSFILRAPEAETVKPNPIVLSNEGFYLLMKAVEAEIDATDSLEGIYATLACTKTIRDEIVR